MYGLTEAGPRVSYLDPELFKTVPQAVGIPLNGVELTIAKEKNEGEQLYQTYSVLDDSYIEAANSEVGRIWISTPYRMVGYYKQEERTKERIHNKWFDTGDVGYIKDGLLYVVGRSDDMIIKSGVNIYPREIESKLLELEEIKEALAYGVIVDGVEQIATDVILEKGCNDLELIKVKEIISKQLPGYLIPSIVNIVKDFKRNGSGKVIRPAKQIRTN